MKTFQVLMSIQQYIEVEAADHVEASMIAWQEYKQGKHLVSAYPEFICEACDLLDHENEVSS